MPETNRILVIEDSLPLATLYLEYLKDQHLHIKHVDTGAEAKRVISDNPPDLILLDLKLPDMDGQDILEWVKNEGIPSAVCIITGHGSVDLAVDLMRLGADDFLEKPITAGRLRTSVHNLLERSRLEHLVQDIQTTFERERYEGFIGSCLPMQATYRIIDAAAPSKATVFITGESGTGKEVCAEAIHNRSPRKGKPFIAINCGAIPHDLMESEIFGHVKGAFTGAAAERKGAAAQADGGTLFLDEVCEMDLELQKKLLRFIQSGRFQKVGSSKEEAVDIRILCATNKDPMEEVNAKRFREDLYYRLHVVPLQLPPLRTRGDDILAIAQQFLLTFAEEEGKRFEGFTPEAEVMLRHYDWPGNVRQLQNVIRNTVVLHDDILVRPHHIPPPLDTVLADKPATRYRAETEAPAAAEHSGDVSPVPASTTIRPLADIEREAIEHAIAVCEGNIPRAAGLLEVSPSTIYRKKQTWEQDAVE
ncbi:sigma-54-dependent Fis family transcriptional regulator [Bacterioplanes sanyensis]|uniref:Sigma-54-dependent Fis family transcriptional regulator n=1 Tax=Bacterioplanes sanyensis TaxID=1249553 RepID=A0A222FLL8_9GAMM|nr:sigma-54 dependent transcriptional regulator [Bacterioplanes sanyensis]ASP39659.1 sigma-54-dependent Fis family transcriptional regulator [Bacterioplanes sanyensis]